MEAATYGETLAWFKGHEKPEVVLLIADQKSLMKILVAWGSLSLRARSELSPFPTGDENDRWKWLWDNTDFDMFPLCEKLGVPEQYLKGLMPLLIGNRVVYPDGTIHSLAQRYLNSSVLRLFIDLKA